MDDKYRILKELENIIRATVSETLASSKTPKHYRISEPISPEDPKPTLIPHKLNKQLDRKHSANVFAALTRIKNKYGINAPRLGQYFQDTTSARDRLEDFAFLRGFAIVRVSGVGDLPDDHPESYPRHQPPHTVYKCIHHQGGPERNPLNLSGIEHITLPLKFDCPEYAKFGCGWSTMVKYDRYRRVWYLKPGPSDHSHPMISNPFDYPQHEYRHPKYLGLKPPPSYAPPDSEPDLGELLEEISHDEIHYVVKSAVEKSVHDWRQIEKPENISIFSLPNEVLLKIARYLQPPQEQPAIVGPVLQTQAVCLVANNHPEPFETDLETPNKIQVSRAAGIKDLIFTNRFFARLLIPEFRKLVEDATDETPNFLWTIKNGCRALCFLSLSDPELHYSAFERNVNYCSGFCDGRHNQQKYRICKGGTALHYAARNGADAVVKKLIDYGAIVNMMNCCGQTPLCVAASKVDKEMVELLLTLGANPYVPQQNAEPATSWAVRSISDRRCDITTVVQLLERRDPNVAEKSIFWTKRMSLHRAAASGNEQVVKMMLSAPSGIDISARSPEGYTALHLAVHNGHFNITRMLLRAGTDCSIRDNALNRPLNYAAMNGDALVVVLLLANGARVNDGAGEITALHFAALYGDIDLVREFVDTWRADINAKDKDNTFPLTYAAHAGNDRVAELLLRRGARQQDTEDRPFMMKQWNFLQQRAQGRINKPVHLISVHQFFPPHEYMEFVRK